MNDSGLQLTPFTLFCIKQREAVIAQNPSLPIIEVNHKLNEMWNLLSDAERLQYVDAAQDTSKQKKMQQQYTYGHSNNQLNGIDTNLVHTTEWPTDPHKYLIWLGAQVLQQFPQVIQENSDTYNLISRIRYNANKSDTL